MFQISHSHTLTHSGRRGGWRRIAFAASILASAALGLASSQAGDADELPHDSRRLLGGTPMPIAETAGDASYPAQTWTLPAITVQGEPSSGLREEERIGSYGQPRWTAHRRFPTTRVYVRPEGEIDMELWSRTKVPKNDGDIEQINMIEFEIGLPHRFQFDIYGITRKKENEPRYNDLALEVRYAFADWGQLPGNPTAYAEWIFKEDSSDVFEGKLLFGGELAPHWHWGTNFVWEQEVDRSEETVLEYTQAFSYSVIDERLSVGIEGKAEIANEKGARSEWHEDIRLGPSLQWRPTQRFHVDIAPLFGLTDESKLMDLYVVAGMEF